MVNTVLSVGVIASIAVLAREIILIEREERLKAVIAVTATIAVFIGIVMALAR